MKHTNDHLWIIEKSIRSLRGDFRRRTSQPCPEAVRGAAANVGKPHKFILTADDLCKSRMLWTC